MLLEHRSINNILNRMYSLLEQQREAIRDLGHGIETLGINQYNREIREHLDVLVDKYDEELSKYV